MTEEEAKTKWCPHAVASHTNPREGFDGQEGRKPLFNCIGSKCMAWRRETALFLKDRDTGATRILRPGETYSVYDGVSYEDFTDEGFCGLAGKP